MLYVLTKTFYVIYLVIYVAIYLLSMYEYTMVLEGKYSFATVGGITFIFYEYISVYII